MQVPHIFAARLRAASKDCAGIASTSINCNIRIRRSRFETSWRLWRSCKTRERFADRAVYVTREHIERARRIVPIVSVQNRYKALPDANGTT